MRELADTNSLTEAVLRRMTAAVPGPVACSAGLACRDGQESAHRLIERADAALYAAKAGGPVVVAQSPAAAHREPSPPTPRAI